MPSRPAPDLRAAAAAGRVLLLLALAAAAGCGKVKSPTEPAAGGGPALTFSQIQAQIFTPNCAKSGCHVPGVAAGGMVLAAGQSYAQSVRPCI